MRYDFPFLFLMVGIGLVYRKLSWKGWFAVSLFAFTWLMFNWLKA